MPLETKIVFRSNGIPLGFIAGGFLFSRDGVYLGWLENKSAWDLAGQYRGQLVERNERHYIWRNKFAVSPVPKTPKIQPATPVIPAPSSPIPAVVPPLGWEDAF